MRGGQSSSSAAHPPRRGLETTQQSTEGSAVLYSPVSAIFNSSVDETALLSIDELDRGEEEEGVSQE